MKAIGRINEELGGSGLPKGCRKAVKTELDLLAGYLGGTRKEAMLFAAVLALNLEGRAADVRRLARFFNCDAFRVARLFPKLHDLVDRGWLRVSVDDDDDDDDDFDPSEIDEPEYGVPRRVFEKLALGREVNTEEKLYDQDDEGKPQDPFKLISKINSFISNRYYDDKPFPHMADRINNLLEANENAVFCPEAPEAEARKLGESRAVLPAVRSRDRLRRNFGGRNRGPAHLGTRRAHPL